jgi:polysaccharide export outer membrane protein
MTERTLRRMGFVVAVGLLFGCASRDPIAPPPDPTPMARETYVLGVTDILRVTVWRNEELSADVPVRPDGKISVALIGDVQAEGLTPEELGEVIARELEEFITAPDVTVVVLEMNSRYVSVMGEVAQTARIPLRSELRVLEAITLVGGFTAFADKSNVRVVRRQEDGSEVEYRFDYDDYIKGNAPGSNIVLSAGDVVIVPD